MPGAKLVSIVAMLLGVALTGCSGDGSDEDAAAKKPAAIAAIKAVMDKAGDLTHEYCSGSKRPKDLYDDGAEAYNKELRSIDLSGCPQDFRTAFAELIAALDTWTQARSMAHSASAQFLGQGNGGEDFSRKQRSSDAEKSLQFAEKSLDGVLHRHGVTDTVDLRVPSH
jgi:hypothetical protein